MAWIAYLPLPGAALVGVFTEPEDPHTRYHAWQGTTWVVLGYITLVALGSLARLSSTGGFVTVMGFLVGAVLSIWMGGLVWGILSAAMGRFARLRPAWDLLVLLGR